MTIETLPVVYRDDAMIAVHKPAGLLVHRSAIDRHETRFAVQIVRNQIGRHVHPAHRLDRGTSGLLLFALERDIARALGAQFTEQRVDKTYLAIVRGHPADSGRIDHALSRVHDDYAGMMTPDGDARSAVTVFRTLARCELPHRVDRYPTSRYALLELKPEAGRQHQLRRHLKHLSHPIVGDTTYGKSRHNRLFENLFGSRRLLLACVSMRLTHPVSGEELCLRAPLAEDFAAVIGQLGWEAQAASHAEP